MCTKTYCFLALLLVALPGMAQQSYSFDLNVIDPCAPAGLQEMNHNFALYPNPSDGLLLADAKNSSAVLSCMDTQGKTVKVVQLQKGKQEISLYDLPAGIYFIRIASDDAFYNTKITVE